MPIDSDRRVLLSARGLTVRFGSTVVIDNVDIEIGAGEIVTLIGPNGSGKTTLVRALLGLAEYDSGEVDREPGTVIGYVPQFLQIDGTMPLTVRRFLELGAPVSDQDLVRGLEEVGIPSLLDAAIQGLSGGEMRRVLLARALLRDSDLLVLDEPTAGVDFAGQAELYKLIGTIRDKRQCGILLISHNLHLVMAATDRVLCLNHHVCCEGRPELVSRNPAYLELFGSDAASAAIAVYSHHHDHDHDLSGAAVDKSDEAPHG
jgi:zinc transport system ATP-binding protein